VSHWLGLRLGFGILVRVLGFGGVKGIVVTVRGVMMRVPERIECLVGLERGLGSMLGEG
jgi:hypothetical protein